MDLNTFNISPGWVITSKLNSQNQFFFVDIEEFDFVMKKDLEIFIEIFITIDRCEIGFMFAFSEALVVIFVRLIRKIKIIRELHEQ
jgi:hypothetical protein